MERLGQPGDELASTVRVCPGEKEPVPGDRFPENSIPQLP